MSCTHRMHAAVYRIGHVSREIFDLYGYTYIRFFRKGYIQIHTVHFVLRTCILLLDMNQRGYMYK